MTEHEAFEQAAYSNEWELWQAACKYQREKDAELCTKEEKTTWENFDDDPSDYREGWADASAWLSNMILNQGDE